MKLSELQEELKSQENLLSKLRLIKIIGDIRDLGFNNASLDNINNIPVPFTDKGTSKRDFFESLILSALLVVVFSVTFISSTQNTDNTLMLGCLILMWFIGAFLIRKLLMFNIGREEKNTITSLIIHRDILLTKLNIES